MAIQSEIPGKPSPAAGKRDASAKPGQPGHLLRLVLVLATTVLLASAWLVFPYFFEGRAVLEDVSLQVTEGRNAEHRTLAQVLTRLAEGPGEAEVDVLFATATYFERTSTPRVTAQYDPENHLVFMVNEGLHVGQLPQGLPAAELIVDGVRHPLADAEGPVDTDHHRSTTMRFAATDASGAPIITPQTRSVTLVMSNNWDDANTPREATWTLPIIYPDPVKGLSSPVLIMSLAAGLLSVTLTPCLLQLIVVYMANLTGISAAQMAADGRVPAAARRKMMLSALAFVIGFSFFYTLAGAIMGYAGKSAQLVFASYSREVAIGAGLLVIAMGLWMGIKARAPIVCKLPAPRMMVEGQGGGYLRSALLAAGFSLGCMVCFSGAIMATMFVYVGSLGSASTGAFILFVFSLGVAIPFLAAAFFLSRTVAVMQWIARYTPQIGFVSMVVIIAFGLVLITDQFHAVSNLIYPWLGLS